MQLRGAAASPSAAPLGKELTMRASLAAALSALALLVGSDSAQAKIVLPRDPVTFRKDAASSKVILYGRLANPGRPPKAGEAHTTDLVILEVLKGDPALGKRRTLNLARHIPFDAAKDPPHLLVFVGVSRGKLDPFLGVLDHGGLLDYARGLLAIDPKDSVKALRHCFDYLDHPNANITRDAFTEFQTAGDKEIRQVAKQLPGARLRRWLQDP